VQVIHVDLEIQTEGRGTRELTDEVADVLRKSKLRDGVATVFCPHTSCSLVLMENASPEARKDLEDFFERLVPPSPSFRHNDEGPDDMPSHIKMALTRSSESIPFRDGRLLLGTWQGIFLWEHRHAPHSRSVVVTVLGE
jgi:secondary thiamine-phosphate synthase enzyme